MPSGGWLATPHPGVSVRRMNPGAQGKVYPDVAFDVTAERVAAFREVFGLAGGVPPTFATAAEFSVLPSIVSDPELELDFSKVLHGSQRYDLRRPLVEGERLVVRARVESIRTKGSSSFLRIAMDLIGRDGEVAVRTVNTMIERRVR